MTFEFGIKKLKLKLKKETLAMKTFVVFLIKKKTFKEGALEE